MKETSFIEQNKEKWNKFQKLTSNSTSEPEEIADLYADITDDLSYAQTFYNKRTVRVYLNQISQGIHNLVHKQRKDSLKKIFTVWRISVPLEMYRARKNMRFALFMFLFWSLVGAISTYINPDFPRLILGDGYVDHTIENIQKGDPLAIYHTKSHLSMFIEITWNNTKVAFYTFIFGVLFTIGTHVMIFNNAVMLGAFQTFFYLKGLLVTSFLGIWIHGSFEISAIVIASGAGLTLGNGLLFPGSYTRLQSFQMAAWRGLKIMLALVPFIIAAGFLESYVTHMYQELSEWSKWAIIIMSFAIIIGYFVIYPLYVARKYPELVYEKDPPVRVYQNTFDLNKIREFGQIFADTFSFYRVHIGKFLRYNLLLTFPLIIAIVILQDYNHYSELKVPYEYDWAHQMSIMMGFNYKSWLDLLAGLGWTIVFSIWCTTIFHQFKYQTEKRSFKATISFIFQKMPGVWCGLIILYVILLYVPWYWMFIMFFISPFLWLQGASMALNEHKFFKRLGIGYAYSAKNYGTILLGIGLMSLVLFVFAQPFSSVLSYQEVHFMKEPAFPDLLDMFADFVKNISRYYIADFLVPANLVRQVVYVLFIIFVFPLFIIMMGFMYHSVHEKYEALGLKKQFENFGKRKRYQETAIDFE